MGKWRRAICVGVLGLVLAGAVCGPSRVTAAVPVTVTDPWHRVAAALAEHLGPAPEWQVLLGSAPTAADPLPVVAAALDGWLRRRHPAADALVTAGLPPYLAARTLVAAQVWSAADLRRAVGARQQLLDLYRDLGLQVPALLPAPPPERFPPAAYGAAAFLFWAGLESELRLLGNPDLWAVLRSGDPSDYSRRARRAAGVAAPATAGAPAAPPEPLAPDPPDASAPAAGPPAVPAATAPAGEPVSVVVPGRTATATLPARLRDGTAWVPVRAAAAALGADADYDGDRDRIHLHRHGRSLSVRPGSRLATAGAPDGERRVLLPAPVTVFDGRAWMPLAPLAESLGAAVAAGPGGSVRLVPEQGPSLPAGTLPPPHGRRVYLTFDDGPSAEITPGILAVLAEYEASATFFVVGQNAVRHPELLRRMVAAGHSVGTHSWDHDYANVYPSAAALVASLQRTAAAVEAVTGRPVRLARAPGGTGTVALQGRPDAPAYWEAVARAGYHLYDWHVDSQDSRRPRLSAAELLHRVQDGTARVDGDVVVLFHDNATHDSTLAALPLIIEWFLAQGFTPAALPAPHLSVPSG